MSALRMLDLVAALLAVVLGIAHSFLGEKYILIRLFRRDDLPKLFGGSEFTVRTLRFAWHLTSIAWWCAAALFFLLAQGPVSSAARGRRLACAVFLLIGCIAHLGMRQAKFSDSQAQYTATSILELVDATVINCFSTRRGGSK